MYLRHLIWLSLLTFAAVWSLDWVASEINTLQPFLPFFPFLMGGSAVFISLFLNQFQPILISLTLLLLNTAVYYFMPAGALDLTTLTLFPLVSLLFPVNVLLWAWLPEKGLHDKGYVLFQGVVLLAQILAVYGFMVYLPLDGWQWILMSFDTKAHQITLPALLAFIGVAGLMLFRIALLRHAKVLDLALLFVLLLMGIGLDLAHQPGVIAWLSTFAGLIILFSLVFDAHHLAYTDQLTGLKGRRALMETFLGLRRRYSIAMMDIDHFKSFNDRYGHEVGDQVLREVAEVLRHISIGKVFRYGGEEFTVVFKNKSLAEVMAEVETIRQKIARLTLKVKQKKRVIETNVTVSFGVAEKTPALKTPDAVMKAADEALYQAKKAGRNQTIAIGKSSPKKNNHKTV